ncbi:23S rRNA (uracil(1939)-C(5))-methyltransferase RlmD [Marinomonas sp. C1424]|uniref:23S rRNA (uracil(1939)-C(5))-methyltransferase RlmD n=2 Tax=Marinomonas transparens TaxID=2795388 RepID=A0A934N2Y6_9GAMM|nr:23S rRNA (uracil(1939)-C(5))-methyltransferase RlmD [Marinomonas transparens]
MGPVQSFGVDGLTHDAKGVARLQGKVTFIAGALPGEVVEARVTKSGRRFDEAILTNILQASDYRVTPVCLHFDQCGGCSFQHLAQPQQIEAKVNWLQGQLRNLSLTEPFDILSDSTTQYRRRARIAVQVKNNQLLLGFRSKASKDIVSIDTCIVLTEALQKVFSSLRQVLLGSELANKLGHIELLEDTKGVSVLFRLTSPIKETLEEEWIRWAQGENIALYWQAPKASKASVLAEDMRYYDLDGQRLAYHPQDFIQVNEVMNEKMVTQALEWLKPDNEDVVLDLFCGVGNFSIPLAKRAQQVIGVEVQDSMVEAAALNAQHNNLSNLSFLAADLTKPIAATFVKKKITKVLLDPPRAGAFEFLDTLIKIKPKQILYVSCNASTLARDAEYLVAKGYQVSRVGLMDMFPQTSHVETMMLLQKKK